MPCARHTGGRHRGQVGHDRDRGRLFVRLSAFRERSAPSCKAFAVRLEQQASHHLCLGIRHPGGGRHYRDRGVTGRYQMGHLSFRRCRRTECQQGGDGGTSLSHSHRHSGGEHRDPFPTDEQRERYEDTQKQTLPARTRQEDGAATSAGGQ